MIAAVLFFGSSSCSAFAETAVETAFSAADADATMIAVAATIAVSG